MLEKSRTRVPGIAKTAAVLCASLLLSAVFAPAFATVTITFEGLRDLETILNYYNGGLGGSGSGPGPNYGVVFGADALAIISSVAGGTGNFSNAPSGSTIAFFTSGPGVVMNVAAGFTTGFSFYYSSTEVGSVRVYDAANGTGNLLATLSLPVNSSTRCNGSASTYSCWSPMGVTFSGTARSVTFGGAANFIGFDNITLGSSTPGGSGGAAVPALSKWGLLLLAILMLAAGARLLRSTALRA